MNTKRLGRGDLLLIAALLLIGLLLSLILLLNRRDGREVVVRVDGAEVARFSLAEDGKYPIESGGAVTNVLRVEGGRVRMVEAECPDHLCIRRGAAQYVGDSIICLPNRVVAEVAGSDELNLDAVAG